MPHRPSYSELTLLTALLVLLPISFPYFEYVDELVEFFLFGSTNPQLSFFLQVFFGVAPFILGLLFLFWLVYTAYPKPGPTSQPVCVGGSLTQGVVSDDWLKKLPMNVTNHGRSGGSSFDILGRLHIALDSSPQWVALWCGTDDALQILEPTLTKGAYSFSDPGTEESFQNNYRSILDALSGTPTLVMTLPPIGEQPNSKANQIICRMNDFIKAEAAERGLPCVDVYALFASELSSDRKAFTYLWALIKMRRLNIASRFARADLDALSDKRGLAFSVDGVHLNHRAGTLVAKAVSETLAQQGWSKAA